MERGPIIRIGQHLEHIVDGDDVKTPGTCLPPDVDRPDAAVRDGAAKNLRIQHARHPHGVGVFGAAGNLIATSNRGTERPTCEPSRPRGVDCRDPCPADPSRRRIACRRKGRKALAHGAIA